MIVLSVDSGFDNFVEFIYVMLIFIAVLIITYFGTRFIGKFQSNKYSTGNIELLEAGRLSANQYIQIVRIGQKLYALAVSKDNVTLIGELSEDEIRLPEDSDKKLQVPGFAEIFEKVRNGRQTK